MWIGDSREATLLQGGELNLPRVNNPAQRTGALDRPPRRAGVSHRCHSRCPRLPPAECGRGIVCRDGLFPCRRNHPIAASSIAAHGAPCMFRLWIHPAPLPPREWTLSSPSERRHSGGGRYRLHGEASPASSRRDCGGRSPDAPWAPHGSPCGRSGPFPATVLHREAGQAILGVRARISQEWPGGGIPNPRHAAKETAR